MDFAFTDEQNMLRDGVERYLSREMDFDARRALVASDAPWSDDAWRHCADMGLLALPFAEDAGGLGGGIADVVAIAEPFGEALVVEPYLACVMLGGAGACRGGRRPGARASRQGRSWCYLCYLWARRKGRHARPGAGRAARRKGWRRLSPDR